LNFKKSALKKSDLNKNSFRSFRKGESYCKYSHNYLGLSKESFYSDFRNKKIKLIQHVSPKELKNQNKKISHLSKIIIPKYNKSKNDDRFSKNIIDNDCSIIDKVKLRSTSSFNSKRRIEHNTIRLNGNSNLYF
jgi:hypothetical protein